MSTSLLAADLSVPSLDYAALAPMLILLGAACVGVLVEAFVSKRARHGVQFVLSLIAIVAAGAVLVAGARDHRHTVTADVALAIDGPTLFLQGALLLLGLLVLLMMGELGIETGGPFVAQAAITAESEADRRQVEAPGTTDVFPLTLFALAGMMMFVAANDLLTMFVALEIFSLPLYLLCALARRHRLVSQEAAMKYFLLGAFASAFFLFGMALLYGFAGTVRFGGLHDAVLGAATSPLLLYSGLALVAVALLFKVAAVPFHVWTPDVYQGAPTSVTALMAACTKVAAFGGLLRVLYVGFDRMRWNVEPVLATIAIITMLVGAILAVTQTDIKRLLAYSSIANAGYLMVGTLAFSKDGLSSSMFYLVAYGLSVLAAFGIVTLVRDEDGEATHLARWAGLGRRSPLLAGVFTLLMFAFAGIPLTSGFWSKFAVFSAALNAGGGWQIGMVIVGVISSMLLAFPYLRVVVMMWYAEAAEPSPTVAIPGAFTSAALMIGVASTLLLGFYPGPVLDLANAAAQFVR